MSEADLQRCLREIREHEIRIGSLSRTLVELDREIHAATGAPDRLARHADFIQAQLMRHRISVALLQSRVPAA